MGGVPSFAGDAARVLSLAIPLIPDLVAVDAGAQGEGVVTRGGGASVGALGFLKGCHLLLLRLEAELRLRVDNGRGREVVGGGGTVMDVHKLVPFTPLRFPGKSWRAGEGEGGGVEGKRGRPLQHSGRRLEVQKELGVTGKTLHLL